MTVIMLYVLCCYRLLLLLSRLLGDYLGQLGQAMVQTQQCIAQCDRHHLGMIYTEALLYWAQLQVCVYTCMGLTV